MRSTLPSITLCCFSLVLDCNSEEATFPAESSFVTKLADDAIAADGSEAAGNRELSRSTFVRAFLGGYSTPGGSSVPVNPKLYWSRLNGKGWEAGASYRRAHPDSIPDVMREFGYREFEGTGVWTVGFEAGGFMADDREPTNATDLKSCWQLYMIHTAKLDAEIGRIVPFETWLHGAEIRIRVKGYLSPPLYDLHAELVPAGCLRILLATSVRRR